MEDQCGRKCCNNRASGRYIRLNNIFLCNSCLEELNYCKNEKLFYCKTIGDVRELIEEFLDSLPGKYIKLGTYIQAEREFNRLIGQQ